MPLPTPDGPEMMIGRTSLGRVAAAIDQLALYAKSICGGRAMRGAGEGEGSGSLLGAIM